jgi:hypothetical protein
VKHQLRTPRSEAGSLLTARFGRRVAPRARWLGAKQVLKDLKLGRHTTTQPHDHDQTHDHAPYDEHRCADRERNNDVSIAHEHILSGRDDIGSTAWPTVRPQPPPRPGRESRRGRRPGLMPRTAAGLPEAEAMTGIGAVSHQQKPSSATCRLSRSSCAFRMHRQVCPPAGDAGIHGS